MKIENDYPVQRVLPRPTDIMWIFTGEWSILDNFALTPVTVDIGWGRERYPTSEHAFAAAKPNNFDDADRIKRCRTPGEAKALGRSVVLRRDWDTVRYDVMWKILQAKFNQHPEAVAKLLETGDRRIYEGNTWNDEIRGVTNDRNSTVFEGRNALGEMLMELRALHRGA